MTLRSDLIAARALIDTPEKWGKGLASFQRGYDPDLEGTLCAMGACLRQGLEDDSHTYVTLASALGKANDSKLSVPDFNDAPTTTHADVMALFQRAIDNA